MEGILLAILRPFARIIVGLPIEARTIWMGKQQQPPPWVSNGQVNDRFSLFSSDQKVTGNWSLFLHLGAYWRTLHIGPYLSFFRSNPLKIRVLDGGGGGIRTHGTLRPSGFQDRSY